MLFQNDPFRDFDNLFGRFGGRVGAGADLVTGMDAYRRDDSVWVHMDVPGVSPDSLDVSVENNVLTIKAERDWQRQEGDQMYLAERARGRFERRVHLGDGLDTDAIEADLSDGVLTLRIPVAEKAQARRIEVNASRPQLEVETTS